jgi:hypothetical protein
MASSPLCRKCGKILDVKLYVGGGFEYHVSCAPDDVLVPGTDETFGDLGLRESIGQIIRWGAQQSERSKQVALGCSEIGDPCERKIGMTMVGLEKTNFTADPWPSIVGTSIHSWLGDTVSAYQKKFGDEGWISELEVLASDWLPGHVDLYYRGTVLDLKNPSRANAAKMRKHGIGDVYEAQIQAYGRGVKRSGRPVDRVGVLMLSRDGNLKDMWCKTWPYDDEFVDRALQRVVDIGDLCITADVENHPENWKMIPPSPSRLCGWCVFYDSNLSAPSDKGCPGRFDDPMDDMFRK